MCLNGKYRKKCSQKNPEKHTWFCNSIECEMWGEHVSTIYRVISNWTDMQWNSKAKSAFVCVLFKAKPFHLSRQSLEYWDYFTPKVFKWKTKVKSDTWSSIIMQNGTGAFVVVFRLTSVTKKRLAWKSSTDTNQVLSSFGHPNFNIGSCAIHNTIFMTIRRTVQICCSKLGKIVLIAFVDFLGIKSIRVQYSDFNCNSMS